MQKHDNFQGDIQGMPSMMSTICGSDYAIGFE